MSDSETMEKYLVVLSMIFSGVPAFGQEAAFQANQEVWLIYEVDKAQTLWNFAESLTVPKQQIAYFLRELIQDNPRLNNPDKIKPGDKILVSGNLIRRFVFPYRKYQTRFATQATGRMPSSQQVMMYEPRRESEFFLRPHAGYTRLDTSQRANGSQAQLISSANFGARMEYNWKNSLGINGVGFEMDWVEFNENLGKEINCNQLLSLSLEWNQNFQFLKSWQAQVFLGYYQSPYLFTDANDDLVLKIGSQPGLALGLSYAVPSWGFELSSKLRFLYFGYAGETFIEDGLSLLLQATYDFKSWEQSWQLSLFGRRDFLQTEVTNQDSLQLGLGLGYSW